MEHLNTTNTKNIIENIKNEDFWMIISCVTITTSVIEVILLVVTCFYYRQRIDWLVERHKETVSLLIMYLIYIKC